MARTDDVNIRLRILGAREIVRGTSQASRSISGMEKKIQKTGASSVLMAQGLESGRRGISAIGTALKYTSLAIGGFAAYEIPRALNAFREAEKADRNVEAAIRSTGGAANVTAKEIGSLSESMMFKVGVDDEEIKNAAAMLLTFKNIRNAVGENNQVFDQTLQTTADMAARFGSDMPNAAKQLAKALNDPSQALSALRRSGVSFTDEQTDMINKWFEGGEKLRAQKYILQELAEQTKGAAVSQADSVDLMQMKWGEIEEQIGRGLMPLMSDLADQAVDVMDRVTEVVNSDDLTGEQKFEAIMDIVDGVVKEGIEGLERYMPQIAEAGAGLGGRFAVSLGRAFLNSNVWGKLFIGVWIWKVLLGAQGTKVLAAVGMYMGRLVFGGMTTAFANRFPVFTIWMQDKFKNAGKWSGRAFVGGLLIGAALLGVWLGQQLTDRLSTKTELAMRQWGINAGQNFVNGLIKAINWAIDRINDRFDEANFLSAVGVDAPEIGRVGEVDFNDGSAGDNVPGWAPPGVGTDIHPGGPKGKMPPRPKQPKGNRLPRGFARRIEVPVYLDGRQIALAVATEAENAAALR